MPYCRPLFLIAFIAIFALVMGCSGNAPVTPENTGANTDMIPVVGLTSADGVYSMVGMMGGYELNLDTNNMTADLVPMRNVAIGESYIVSGLGFFTQVPCATCLKVTGVDFETDVTGTFIKVGFNADHPFDPGVGTQPPSARNRLDLDVFDLALVIVPLDATADSYSLTDADAYATICAKADGYTTELSEVTTDTAACPYFLVVDDAEAETNTFNKFAMGAEDILFDVYFRDGGPFNMYLTMGYGFSAKKAQRLTPKYYNPEFNRKAAWKVAVEIPSGANPPAMGNTWDDSDITTTYDLVVKVYDWQQGVSASATVPYDDEADTTLVYAVSNVSEVSLEVPGMFSPIMTMDTADSGSGAPDDPLVYTFSVANANGLDAGTYYGLVKVTDERSPLTPTDSRDFIIDSPDGIALNNYSIPEYAAYQIFPAIIVVGCGPISGSITDPVCPVTGVFNNGFVAFTASASSANGGNPVSYEWDMDYDGTTFDVDATGITASLGPFTVPDPCIDNIPYDFTVACRVTDSCSPANVTIVDTCTVTVDECNAPVTPVGPVVEPPTPGTDQWFDVGVMPNGLVYVVASVSSTGNNTNTTRTCIKYNNDLTSPVVINPGTGMCDVWGNGFTTPFTRVDVSNGGFVGNNPETKCLAFWSISGSAATDISPGGGCWVVSCGSWIYGVTGMHDVWAQNATATGWAIAGFEQITDCGTPYDSCIFAPDSTHAINFSYGASIYTTATAVVGVGGIDGSNNAYMLVSNSSLGKLSRSGGWFTSGVTPTELASTGSYGTADGQFSGGLDVALDSAGNILTLENHGGGVYRFQKFDSALTWQWSSPWVGQGNPLRMDYDKADDMLYLLSDTHLTVCSVL
jgi:hypothetical protein